MLSVCLLSVNYSYSINLFTDVHFSAGVIFCTSAQADSVPATDVVSHKPGWNHGRLAPWRLQGIQLDGHNKSVIRLHVRVHNENNLQQVEHWWGKSIKQIQTS
jgi:chorismate mutase